MVQNWPLDLAQIEDIGDFKCDRADLRENERRGEDSDYRQLFLGVLLPRKKNGGSYQKTVESGEVF